MLATIYAALFRKERTAAVLLPTGMGGQIAEVRLATFMTWCFQGTWNRAWALHASIASLAIGVGTLPVPFIEMAGWAQTLVLILGVLAVAATGFVSKVYFGDSSGGPPAVNAVAAWFRRRSGTSADMAKPR